MTNLERISFLVYRDICNGSVPWTSAVMVSELASS